MVSQLIIATLVSFDLIYLKFSERSATPCLVIATTPPALIQNLQKFHPILLIKSSKNSGNASGNASEKSSGNA